jgi:Arc/MetJ-type ribon-helix-helix transcriptional regulator
MKKNYTERQIENLIVGGYYKNRQDVLDAAIDALVVSIIRAESSLQTSEIPDEIVQAQLEAIRIREEEPLKLSDELDKRNGN